MNIKFFIEKCLEKNINVNVQCNTEIHKSNFVYKLNEYKTSFI